MSPAQEKRARRSLLLGSALAGLLIIEGAGRLLRVLPSRPSRPYLDLTSAVGPLPAPSSRNWISSSRDGFSQEIRFNALGFRGGATDFPPGNRRRILVLGDSYTAAWQVALSDRWSERLTALRPDWSTLNLGMPNWGTDQEVLTLQHYPLSRPPDQVVLMFFPGNDVSDNATLSLTGHPPNHPHFVADGPISDDPLRLRAVAWRYRDPMDLPSELPFPGSVRAWLHLHSVTYWALGEIRRQLTRPASVKKAVSAGVSPLEVGVFEAAKAEQWETPWRMTESLLLAMKASAGRLGADLAVVLVPPYAAVQPELTPGYMKVDSARFDLALPARRLMLFAQRHHLAMLDLTPGFTGYRRPRPHSELFYVDDKHFTPEGHCVASALIANWLDPARESGNVLACSGAKADAGAARVQRP